jgi:exosortase/archaeosortase family protein
MTVAMQPAQRSTFDWKSAIRPVLAISLIAIAYRTSLMTLFESMRLDTPLAHLALVPLIAGGLAYSSRHNDTGPAIHDRQLDWIVGITLGAVALSANLILPARLSSDFWLWRLDLLTLPVFTAAVVSLLFGVRTLWKYRLSVLFLFLAWPVPYNWVLDRWLGRITSSTIWALERTLQHLPWATKVTGTDSLFQVAFSGKPIQMSVASACSGANGMVGFMLVATAFVFVVKGSRWTKIAWLLTGVFLVWTLNVVRIMSIFFAARQWGESVAIDGFHPYVGLVVFNVAVIVMVLLMRVFRLQFKRPSEVLTTTSTYRPRASIALSFAVLMALAVGVFNGELRAYDRIAGSLGTPRLTSFEQSRETPDGWALSEVDRIEWTRRFFGDDSQWIRYQYMNPSTAVSEFSANLPITVDVIDTSDRAALNAYGIEECYKFHGYNISGRQSIDLGGGVVGGALTWFSPKTDLTWTTLYWHWPIKTATGTRYERVTLILQDQESNQFTSPPLDTDGLRQLQLDVNDALRGAGSPALQQRLVETRQFMIGFARELISLRTAAPEEVAR